MQAICEALESGYELRLENNLFLARLIAEQRTADDEVLRRWFYKFVGLSGSTAYLPLLLRRSGEEIDPQTVSWVIGAVVAMMEPQDAIPELRAHGAPEQLLESAGIFGGYFRPELIDQSAVASVIAPGDGLLSRWASFLNARWRSEELGEYVAELNLAADAEVAEFSVWSIGRSSGRLVDTLLDPDRIPGLPSQVRRWSYHLVAADPEARLAYADLISTAREEEKDERVREGLAMGLVKAPLKGSWLEFTKEWHSEEGSDRVRSALERRISIQPGGRKGEKKAVILVPRRNRRKEGRQRHMFGVSRVDGSVREMVYFLALDTVSFSVASDGDQLSIVTSLLSELSSQPDLLSLSGDTVISLFTGDGVILGVRQAENALVPLRAALALQQKFQTVYRYEVRMGINSGSVNVLSMSDGSTQLIGHAINQTARVMAVAPINGVTISESYYAEALHSGREPLIGYRLDRRSAKDKHENAFECFDVVMDAGPESLRGT